MFALIDKISNTINFVVGKLLALLVAVLTILTTTGVVTRYVTGKPIIWLSEVTVVTFVWATFLGVSVGFKKGDQIALEFFQNRFKTGGKRTVKIIILLFTMAFLVIGIVEGFQIVRDTYEVKYNTVDLSTGWFYASFPVSAIISLIHLISETIGVAVGNVDINAEKEQNLSIMG